MRLTFCRFGAAATIVVSCRIGNTVHMFHKLCSTSSITSPISSVPRSAALILGWMLWSQIPVMLLGAWTSWLVSGAGGGVAVVVVPGGADPGGVPDALDVADGAGVADTLGVVVATAVASKAGQPKRDARAVARSPPA